MAEMEGNTHVGICRLDDTGKTFGDWIYVPTEDDAALYCRQLEC